MKSDYLKRLADDVGCHSVTPHVISSGFERTLLLLCVCVFSPCCRSCGGMRLSATLINDVVGCFLDYLGRFCFLCVFFLWAAIYFGFIVFYIHTHTRTHKPPKPPPRHHSRRFRFRFFVFLFCTNCYIFLIFFYLPPNTHTHTHSHTRTHTPPITPSTESSTYYMDHSRQQHTFLPPL